MTAGGGLAVFMPMESEWIYFSVGFLKYHAFSHNLVDQGSSGSSWLEIDIPRPDGFMSTRLRLHI